MHSFKFLKTQVNKNLIAITDLKQLTFYGQNTYIIMKICILNKINLLLGNILTYSLNANRFEAQITVISKININKLP